jgi:hypothetical protein
MAYWCEEVTMAEIGFFKAILLTNLWIALYILDLYLTSRAEREYLQNAKDILFYEAGYELVDPAEIQTKEKPTFTYRSIILLITSAISLMLTWLFVAQIADQPGVYSFILGGLMLSIAAVDFRHIQNIFLYNNTGTPNGLKGRLEYPGWIGYRSSSLEMFIFACIFLILALILPSWFIAGGSFGCAGISIRHWIWSNRYLKSSPAS